MATNTNQRKKTSQTPHPNYQILLDDILSSLSPSRDENGKGEQGKRKGSDGNGESASSGKRKRLLLHACCAPCSSAVLEYLAEYMDITLYFYNPNIASPEEFRHRAEELVRLVKEMGLDCTSVEILIPPYCHQEFLEVARGLEQEPERGKRCEKCFRLRLQKTAEEAARQAKQDPSLAYDYICTTLSLSPLKDAVLLNRLGTEIAASQGLCYLPSDFKKRGRYQRSIELSRQYGLYRQNFCGCEFSRKAYPISPG